MRDNSSVIVRLAGNASYPIEIQLLNLENGSATRLILWPAFRDMGTLSVVIGDVEQSENGELSIAGGSFLPANGRYAIAIGYDAPVDQTVTTSWQNATLVDSPQTALGSQFRWSRPDSAVDKPENRYAAFAVFPRVVHEAFGISHSSRDFRTDSEIGI